MPVDRAAVVRRADEFVSQGKLDLAIAEYRGLLDEQPSDLGAANTLGDLYARTGEIAKAVEQFTRLAESERAQGFTSKAIALYKKALKVDPGCEQALSQLAEIAVGQELLADATLYWNRLVQHRRDRNDMAGVAQALVRLASLSVAKADTKLAAARAAEAHLDIAETARLYAAAAEALTRDGRVADALEAWLEAAQRTDDADVRGAAARACLESNCLDRAQSFLSVEVAGDEPALLWAVGERAALSDNEAVATRALGRYRMLVPDDAERASALLARWETSVAVVADETEPAWREAAIEPDVDLAAMLTKSATAAPVPLHEQVFDQPDTDGDEILMEAAEDTADSPPADDVEDDAEVVELAGFSELDEGVELPVVEDVEAVDDVLVESAEDDEIVLILEDDVEAPHQALLPPEPEAPVVVEPARPAALAPAAAVADAVEGDDEGDEEVDEAATIAQLQAAADTPALQFQAAAQLGRWFVQKGQLERGVEWLERACAVPAPVREHGLAARYDLADALERAGQRDRALACWSDLEFDAGSYRDVPERLDRLTRALGSGE
jgi:tetratricopeptide (TPR) repeat protein